MNKHFTVGTIAITLSIFALIIGTSALQLQQSAYSLIDPNPDFRTRAPIAISGDNVYIVWTTDKNMPNNNSEVMFRASTEVTWWERNQTSEEPVFRASVDNGLTFGPLLSLGANGTLGLEQEVEE